MTGQSTNDLSIMIGGDAGQGVESSGAHQEPDPYFDSNLFLGWVLATVDATGGVDKTEGGLDLFVAYSTDEAIDRCRCVFKTLKSTLGDRQSELISIHLPDSIQQIYAES